VHRWPPSLQQTVTSPHPGHLNIKDFPEMIKPYLTVTRPWALDAPARGGLQGTEITGDLEREAERVDGFR
jgi:hypothetical protein